MEYQFTKSLRFNLHLPNHWVSIYIYRITEFQFTQSLSFNLPNHWISIYPITVSIYRITEFQFADSLSFKLSIYRIKFNLPNHKLSIYHITNFQFTACHVFQFTAIINLNLPHHENSIYRVMKILPNHRICEISIYHRTDKSISVHESSVLSGGVSHGGSLAQNRER